MSDVTLKQIIGILPITNETFITVHDAFDDNVYKNIMVKDISENLLNKYVVRVYPPEHSLENWYIYVTDRIYF